MGRPFEDSLPVDTLEPLPDLAVCFVGLLGDQAESERNAAAAKRVMHANYTAPALLLGALAQRFEHRGSGTLVGVASVAGDRGRAVNYVYGSAKAGLTAFLSGLHGRLAGRGVHVVTVKPGFVRTRMTASMDLPALLTASPEEAAAAIAQAVDRRRNVVYVRRTWRFIMSRTFSARVGALSRAERLAMVERGGELSLARQCGLLGIGRASPCREPARESEANLALMRCLDELYVECPFHGSGRWRGTCGARGRSRVGTAFAG